MIQYITYHLADSFPQTVLERMRHEVDTLPLEVEMKKLELRKKIVEYLVAGHGSCILRVPEIARCIEATWFLIRR